MLRVHQLLPGFPGSLVEVRQEFMVDLKIWAYPLGYGEDTVPVLIGEEYVVNQVLSEHECKKVCCTADQTAGKGCSHGSFITRSQKLTRIADVGTT